MSHSDNQHGQGSGGHGGHGGETSYPYTPHHFFEAKQHFESGKMGVWLFLVTEILFFAGLFCAYTVYRAQHPEIFYWAHFYLDTTLGAANTVVLILSSFTAAWAVRNAQKGELGLLRMNIVLTICGALFFMGVKTIEYRHKFHDGLLPARHFAPTEEVWETHAFVHKHPAAARAAERISAGLAARRNKTALVDDLILQRQESAPLVPTVHDETKAATPAADGELRMTTKAAPTPEAAAAPSAQAAPTPRAATTPEAAPAPEAAPVPEAATAEAAPAADAQAAPTAGLPAAEAPVVPDDIWLAEQIRKLTDEERRPLEMAGVIRKTSAGPPKFARPENAGIFFSIYFFMTGLHGFHVVIGIGIWIWMLAIASKRKFGPQYFGPIEFSALYWHLVDLIWIYLFPMLYLIH